MEKRIIRLQAEIDDLIERIDAKVFADRNRHLGHEVLNDPETRVRYFRILEEVSVCDSSDGRFNIKKETLDVLKRCSRNIVTLAKEKNLEENKHKIDVQIEEIDRVLELDRARAELCQLPSKKLGTLRFKTREHIDRAPNSAE